MDCGGRFLVRIRIYGIIGFTGFARRASLTGKRSYLFVLAEFAVMRKAQARRSEILKIPLILKILILTKARRIP